MEPKDRILIIKAGEGSLVHEGFTASGYTIMNPYKDKNLLGRVLRDIWFKIFLPQRIWYNKQIKEYEVDTIVVYDVLITKEFLDFILLLFPSAHLNFVYSNLVGHAKHIMPDEIPSAYKIWTFDKKDSVKYGLNLFDSCYFDSLVKPKKPIKYDVLYVGADKGRGDYLISVKKRLEELGLVTKFIITKDGRLSKNKPYYTNPISYSELTELIAESRSILNVSLPGQVGFTMRDMEALFFKVKLLTTNKAIVDADFYNENNIFLFEGLNLEGVPAFLDLPTYSFPKQLMESYSLSHFVCQMCDRK